jgi:5S rRNA maturation endonuclease (ribonuclease M5)
MQTELRIECPACDNLSRSGRYDPVAYLNPDKGVYFCQRCHSTGPIEESKLDSLNVISIKEYQPFNPKVYDELEPLNSICFNFLEKRFPNVDPKNLELYGLKYHRDYHAIAIPVGNGTVVGIKYRLIAPLGEMRYLAEQGSQFGGYWLDGRKDRLLIVEGEFDAISAKLMGFEGTVLALQTNRLSDESIKRVRSFKNIFLALDSDEAGLKGQAEIQSLVQPNEPTLVELPEGVKDLNELLQNTGVEEGSRLLRLQTKTELERATLQLRDSVAELINFLSDQRNTKGDTTGWNCLDQLLGGGLRPNEMTVINAFAKTGKTSFINNLVHNLALSNKRIGIASFEMDPARMLYPSLLSIAGQTNIRQISARDELTEVVSLIEDKCPYLSNLITLRQFGYTPWSEIEEWAALMKEQHQIEYLVLDHAGFMVEKMTDAEDNQILAKNIKKLTNTLGLHILVVVQAPKTKDGLSIQTSYGGLAWGMNADNFIILERSKEDESELRVRLEAARYPGANPSHVPAKLFYDRETCSLNE